MATNWKKTELQKRDLLIACLREDLKDAVHSRSALKGQLTRERKKNAEARELVELLEWAKKADVAITIYENGKASISNLVKEIVYRDNLLLALRAAKKILEGEK